MEVNESKLNYIESDWNELEPALLSFEVMYRDFNVILFLTVQF
jgi:uncharacterized protein YbdZ (MbtH family)